MITDLREQLQSALGSVYQLERELGGGGMSRVFVAEEHALGRRVVIKVLPPELAAAVNTERFRREIRVAASLLHPHIVPLLSAGEAGGLLYYTMPFVEGESLRARLTRTGELPVPEAVCVLRDVAHALAYAHRHGVVHRDIKPENILVAGDHALVTDFGVAKALSSATTGGAGTLTVAGTALGTPAYMAPEQAAGDPIVDQRADLYAWGGVAYEVLSGQPPFTGRPPAALLAAHLTLSPEPVTRYRASVPPGLGTLVMRCLEKRPADRPQTAEELLRELDRATTNPYAAAAPITAGGLAPSATTPTPSAPPRGRLAPERRRIVWRLAAAAGVALALVLAVLAGLLGRSRAAGEREVRGATAMVSPIKMLVVLPFENLGRPEDEYFTDGLTEEIRSRLGSIQELRVIARQSAEQYKRSSKPIRQIGRELGVQYVLDGTVRWQKAPDGGSRVRVAPQLIRVLDETQVWADQYDAALADVFEVQADLARQVAAALDIALGEPERRSLEAKPTENLVAYDAYLKGSAVLHGVEAGTVAGLRRAIEQYERAVALDPAFALAWARLSQAYTRAYGNTAAPSAADLRRAEAAADRALQVAPGLPEGQLALGDCYRARGDAAQALEQYALGRERAPNNAELLTAIAVAEQDQGRWEAALAHLREAQLLDPRSVGTTRRMALTLLWLRRYPEALEAADRALALMPGSPEIYTLQLKAMVYLAQGDLGEARAVITAAAPHVDPTALVVEMGQYWDLFWVLDDAQQALLLRLTPAPFGNDTVGWGLALAGTRALRGEMAQARAYADSARSAAEARLKSGPVTGPAGATLHASLGVAYAYLGRTVEAVKEGQRGVALAPLSEEAYFGAYIQHQLARIYTLVGEADRAVATLEPLLKVPYFLSPAWLEIDPTLAPLRGHPRFRRLLEGTDDASRVTE